MEQFFFDESLDEALTRAKRSLSECPDETLEALARRVCEEECVEREAASLEEARKHCLVSLDAMLGSLARFASASSPRTLLFTDVADRERAYAALCHLLLSLDARVHELREVCVQLSNGEERDRARVRVVLLRSDLTLLSTAGKDTPYANALRELLARLERTERMRRQRETSTDALLSGVRGFCTRTVPRFYTTLEEKGDMLHGGRDCDVHALIRLSGELRGLCSDTKEAILRAE